MENLFCQQAPASAGAGSGGNAAVNGTAGKDVKDSGEKDKKKDDVSSSFIVITTQRQEALFQSKSGHQSNFIWFVFIFIYTKDKPEDIAVSLIFCHWSMILTGQLWPNSWANF